MINIENVLNQYYPNFSVSHKHSFRAAVPLLRLLCHEKEFLKFEKDYPHLSGFDFIEQVLNYFDFRYTYCPKDLEKIPSSGRVVIIANHPIGSLDGLALLDMIKQLRPDVKVVANRMLMTIKPLHSLLLPVINMDDESTPRKNIKAIKNHLSNEGVVVFFPAGSVSRVGMLGIRDGTWNHGFLSIANNTKSPILPIHVDGKNSLFFYAISILSKPASSLLLIQEMFKQENKSVAMTIGEKIEHADYQALNVKRLTKIHLFKKHLYNLSKGKPQIFKTQTAIALAENRQLLKKEIHNCELLGATKDDKKIYLFHFKPDSSIMREISRLREISFRAVGEGTGKRRDFDRYDQYYMHLILWDEKDLEIAGAYRLCDTNRVLSTHGIDGIYTETLFTFNKAMKPYFARGLELGRSFVQPKYWGKRSLDYLWFGIGALLKNNPQYRYLFGPVSISDRMPQEAKEMLVYFYGHYFNQNEKPAVGKSSYQLDPNTMQRFDHIFKDKDYKAGLTQLKAHMQQLGVAIPTLYKQYTEICEPGGVFFSDFNLDEEFGNCIDGFVIVDIEQLKPQKRSRYIGEDKHLLD